MEEMNKKRRRAVRGIFTKTVNELKAEFKKSSIDKENIYAKYKRLESLHTELVALNEQCQLVLLAQENITDEEIDREYEDCEKYIQERFSMEQKICMLRDQAKDVLSNSSKNTKLNKKLPELELKTYDGSLENWLPWWAQFSKAILPESEAYRVIASYPVTGDNYTSAIQALQERFGDPNILMELYVRRLLNLVMANVRKENRNLSLYESNSDADDSGTVERPKSFEEEYMGLKNIGKITIVKSLFGGRRVEEERHGRYILNLEKLNDCREKIQVKALDQPKICDNVPPLPRGEWCRKLSSKEGREDVNDEERAGRPSTSTTDEKINEVEKMILANRRITVREVAEDLNISIGSCHSIFINDLGMRRVAGKFVPKLLNCDQKQHRMNIANEMLDSVHDDPNLLQRVITGHEAGVVHHEFLPQGRTVNKEYYLQVMRNLREAIRQKRPDLWKNKNWLLHHDNAPAHTSLLVRDFLAKKKTHTNDAAATVFPRSGPL
ncbi:hypothetical protein LAZ67_16002673 [Cordylochernes scorpioides]|uniref:Transposase n=1 Tax=Cordylochernes scorpioides TaxID=51811 RepID=A0ABY6LC61_9ARAC|nr:hypothetical protein LAZ67_16002673 [Cordylochernes scorpioides]